MPFLLHADLTEQEVAAIRRAAVWYAKYHESRISELAKDPSAYAVVEREEYLDLVAALGKLGVRLPVPDGVVDERQAA